MSDDKTKIRSWSFGILALFYGVGLYFFYVRYVPLVRPYQLVLIPILALTALLTAANPRWGTLLFIFLFPLISNLPYVFGIYENIPQAPTALVLFMFFFLGHLVRLTLVPKIIQLDSPIFRPLVLFALVVIVSAIITIFRFANFFPFRSDYVYELITSVISVSAGGAIMSTVFYALNYLSALAFFAIVWTFFKDRENFRLGWNAFIAGLAIALAFGLYQRYWDLTMGNSPIRINLRTINSTFKDPNSFGAYLAMALPVMFGLFFARKWPMKLFAGAVFLISLLILPYTGSGSGLLGIAAALLFFLIMAAGQLLKMRRTDPARMRKLLFLASMILLCFGLLTISLMTSKESNLFYKLKLKVVDFQKGSSFDMFLHRRWEVNWEDAIAMARDYPFTGVGIGAYTIEVPNYAELAKKSWPIGESAENHLLQVASELGFPGVVLVLWISWELAKGLRRKYLSLPPLNSEKFLWLGLLAGMLSFLINLQFHSYIGSCEIKYTFWLIAALALRFPAAAADDPDDGEKKIFFSKRFKIWSAAALVVFGGIHLWNSTHSLSLKSRTEIFHLKQNIGLYQVERMGEGSEFRWTQNYGGFDVIVSGPVVEIPLHASHPDLSENPVKVRVFLVKDLFRKTIFLGEITIASNAWKTYEFPVEDYVSQKAILLLKVSRTWNPLKTTGVPDPRDLGVAVGPLRFKARPTLSKAPSGGSLKNPDDRYSLMSDKGAVHG
jgi:hypothetical protein